MSINGIKIEEELNNAILRTISGSLVWKQLQYQASIDDDGRIELACEIFSHVRNDLKQMENIQYFHLLIINYNFSCSGTKLELKQYLSLLEYLLISLLLNIELKYPLIFSFYGRHLFQRNYSMIVKTIEELSNPKIEGPKFECNRNQILSNNMRKLQRKILYEYNTLNILKECNDSSSRRKSCDNYKKKSADYRLGTGPIKCMVYDMRFIDMAAIEKQLGVTLV